MTGSVADKQARLGAKQAESTIYNDNTSFMMDSGLYNILYNMWGEFSVSIDAIQDKMIKDDNYDSSIVCFTCKAILDHCCHIIKSNVFGQAITPPTRSALTVDIEPVISINYFREASRRRALNAFFTMLTRNMAMMNTDAKSKIIDYTYIIKHKLTNN